CPRYQASPASAVMAADRAARAASCGDMGPSVRETTRGCPTAGRSRGWEGERSGEVGAARALADAGAIAYRSAMRLPLISPAPALALLAIAGCPGGDDGGATGQPGPTSGMASSGDSTAATDDGSTSPPGSDTTD